MQQISFCGYFDKKKDSDFNETNLKGYVTVGIADDKDNDKDSK